MRLTAACLALMIALTLIAPALADDWAWRMPAPAVMTEEEQASVLAAGSVERSPWLDTAFTLLEEGNPFRERYNLITGANIRARLPFGVPYLYGGQTPSHVFAKEPNYVVQAAWTGSPTYFVAGRKYLYGFDCVGFIRWVWSENRSAEWPGCDNILTDRRRQIYSLGDNRPDWVSVARNLQVGDILVLRHPGNHVAMYIGTLRDYGYTADEVPELADYLDYPLVIHSAANASMWSRFDWLIKNGLPKYRVATTTDGGVCVAILGVPLEAFPDWATVSEECTRYFTLPDGTWLTGLIWRYIVDYCWWRDT